jgi:mannosylfructose-6-phosphate phosphatase
MPIQPTNPDLPFLLAADIDGTLLGDKEGELLLWDLICRFSASFHLAYVTGRSLADVLKTVEEGRLPRPDFICSYVGSELLDCHDPVNAIGQRYAAQVSPHWDIATIYALGEGEGIRRQDFPEGQPRFHAGFDWDGQPDTLTAFRQRMAACDDCSILASYNRYIDVLPPPLGKGQAVRFLQKELKLDAARVVVAGDSGNDRQMFETEFRGIVPCNALAELKAAACQPWHYHSPLSAGRGVLDGLKYFDFLE